MLVFFKKMNYQYSSKPQTRPYDKQKTMLIGGAALLGVGILIILAFVAYIVYNVIQNQQIQAKYLSSTIQTTGLGVSAGDTLTETNNGKLGDNLTVYSISGQQSTVRPTNLSKSIQFVQCYNSNFGTLSGTPATANWTMTAPACYVFAKSSGTNPTYFGLTNLNNSGLGTCSWGTTTEYNSKAATATVSTNCGTETPFNADQTGWIAASQGGIAIYQMQ